MGPRVRAPPASIVRLCLADALAMPSRLILISRALLVGEPRLVCCARPQSGVCPPKKGAEIHVFLATLKWAGSASSLPPATADPRARAPQSGAAFYRPRERRSPPGLFPQPPTHRVAKTTPAHQSALAQACIQSHSQRPCPTERRSQRKAMLSTMDHRSQKDAVSERNPRAQAPKRCAKRVSKLVICQRHQTDNKHRCERAANITRSLPEKRRGQALYAADVRTVATSVQGKRNIGRFWHSASCRISGGIPAIETLAL